MTGSRHGRLLGVALATLLLAGACTAADAAVPTTSPSDTSGPTTPTTNAPTPTQPTTPTTSQPPTTTAPPPTNAPTPPTTAPTSIYDDAEGSGCTPGQGNLPDGKWFGYVAAADDHSLEFDLACWFTGKAADRAAKEAGDESPVPNGYYVSNTNDALRTVEVGSKASVVWYPNVGDPSSETTSSLAEWVAQTADRQFSLGVWLTVSGGEVTHIQEQWIP